MAKQTSSRKPGQGSKWCCPAIIQIVLAISSMACAEAPKATIPPTPPKQYCTPDFLEAEQQLALDTWGAAIEFDCPGNIDVVVEDMPEGQAGFCHGDYLVVASIAWDYDGLPEFALAHEIGHSLGHEHDDSDPCGVMRTYWFGCPDVWGQETEGAN